MRFKTLILTLLVLVGLCAAPASAATALTATTLSAATTATASTVTVTSASGLTVGWIMYVDREAMVIRSITSTTIGVSRGTNGTAPAAHAILAGVLAQVPSAFASTDVSGSCSTLTEEYLPHVNIAAGNTYDCLTTSTSVTTGAGLWTQYKRGGFPVTSATFVQALTSTTATVLIKPGMITLGGTAQTYTIAAPAVAQNGMRITFINVVAQINTVVVTGSITGASTSASCAMTNVIGNHIAIEAREGRWYIVGGQGLTCTIS
jgi:hypothetical protein